MKLSAAQQHFLAYVDGAHPLRRRERDGTVMPYVTEARTVAALVRLGVLRWVHAGKDGFTYNGVVRAKEKAK